MKHWFVIQVMSGHEKKIKKAIDEGKNAQGVAELIEEVLVPTENVAEVKSGQRRVTEKRLWPGYAIVKMDLTDEVWHFIKETTGVIGFMGGGKPVPLTEAEVEGILADLKSRSGEVVQKHNVQVGDRVKIVDGVFADFAGTVVDVNHEKGVVSVEAPIFGRNTTVDDLEFWQIEELPEGEA